MTKNHFSILTGRMVTWLLTEETPSYQHLHHLVGALQYLVHPNIPKELFDGIVLQISISTVHLKSLVHNLNDVIDLY